MGCGRTNTSQETVHGMSNNNNRNGFIISHSNYMKMIESFDKFLQKNPNIDISKIKLNDTKQFCEKIEQDLISSQITQKVALAAVTRIINMKEFKNYQINESPYFSFFEILDKIKQLDSDIKQVKEIIKNLGSNTFHQPESNSVSYFLDCDHINENYISNFIDYVKFEINESVSHLTVIITNSQVLKGKLILEITDLIKNLKNLISISILFKNTNEKEKSLKLDAILPLINSIRYNSKIRNIAIGCYNCIGFVPEDVQNEILYMITDNLVSIALSNINFSSEHLEYIIERMGELKNLKMFLYEPIEKFSTDQKKLILDIFSEKFVETDNVQMIYFTGFDDLNEDYKVSYSNKLRKNGIIKNVIFDESVNYFMKKYYF